MIPEPKPKHRIPVKKGAEMTARFRKEKKKILKDAYENVLPTCETFDRVAIDRLLKQPGCKGLRVYYSMDESLQVHALLVGVDAENRDILTISTDAALEADGEVLDESQRCPTNCPPPSEMNS